MFNESGPANRLFDLIAKYSFGLLVSQHDGEPFATHLPMLVDRADSPNASSSLSDMRIPVRQPAMATSRWAAGSGDFLRHSHAYISPSLYERRERPPTWNYVAVHVYGRFRAVQDEQPLMKILQETVTAYEASRPQPWQMEADSDFTRKMANAVVSFRIEISRIEGKLKLNQNHPQARGGEKAVRWREGKSTDHNDVEIAALMTESMNRT